MIAQNVPGQSGRTLILASASPRRKELLESAGFTFTVTPASIEERQKEGEVAEDFVRRIAEEKAEAVFQRLPANLSNLVLGADTVVVVDGATLGKPASTDDARRMLRLLSGRQHRVLTGICLIGYILSEAARTLSDPWRIRKDVRVASTSVAFLTMSEEEIEEYIATGEPFDKAGAYGIQGRASKFVEKIDGCYFNVVGLPLSLVHQMIKEFDE